MKTILVFTVSVAFCLAAFPVSILSDACPRFACCDTTIASQVIDTTHVVRTNLQRSVVRICMPNGQSNSTGTLINNVQCGNSTPKPYVFACAHALLGADLDSMMFVFGFVSDTCVDPDPDDQSQPPSASDSVIIGATRVAYARDPNDAGIDYMLLELHDDPIARGFNPFYAGWTINQNITSPTVGLSHLGGLPLMITLNATAPADNWWGNYNLWGYDDGTDYGQVSQGSSGSGLFTLDTIDCKLIGSLSGSLGWSTCHGTDISYTKFSTSWNEDCCNGTTGNADFDSYGQVTVGDVGAIIEYLFLSQTPPPCPVAADVNADGWITISDLGALNAYLLSDTVTLATCEQARAYWPQLSDFLDPTGTLDSLNGWDSNDAYPYANGCQ